MSDFEITKRELIFSVLIVSIMLVIGVVIAGNINDNVMERVSKYNTALQIDNNRELFEYGMRTNVGNALVYGELKAMNPVSYPEVEGIYSSMTKVTERYTMHTRTVTTRDSNGHSHTKTEHYWTWDRIGSEEKHTDTISLIEVELPYETIEGGLPEKYLVTKDAGFRLRNKYYGSDTAMNGTLFTQLSDDTVAQNSPFYCDMTIEETLTRVTSSHDVLFFWFFWIILTGCVVVGFYYLENNWLED